ncbi:MAG: alpha/beta fold hydrolase [Bacteroidota bacterium]
MKALFRRPWWITGVSLLLGGALRGEESPFPDRELLAGARVGSIVQKPGQLYGHTADFGLILVPENRNRPGSRLVVLPFIRHRARGDSSSAPVFILGGGPGKSNLWREMPEVFYTRNAVVHVGYRGVDGEVKLKCPEIGVAMTAERPLSHETLDAFRRTIRSSYERLIREGVDPDGYSVMEVVEDMEALRVALGYGTINLFSTSFGTQIGTLYCLRHPQAVHRNLMIGASRGVRGLDELWDPEVVDSMLGRYAALWQADGEARGGSPDLLGTMRSVLGTLPVTWNGVFIDPDKVRLAAFYSLYETESAAAVLDAFVAAEKGDPGGLALLVVGYDEAVQDTTRQYWGEFLCKFASAGYDSTRDHEREMDPPGSVLGSPSAKLWWTAIPRGGWPVRQIPPEYRGPLTVRTRTLIVNGELDFSSPPANMREAAPWFPDGTVIEIPCMGHMDVFKLQRGAVDHLAERFFLSGVADTSRYRPHLIDFTPEETLQGEARRIFGTGGK